MKDEDTTSTARRPMAVHLATMFLAQNDKVNQKPLTKNYQMDLVWSLSVLFSFVSISFDRSHSVDRFAAELISICNRHYLISWFRQEHKFNTVFGYGEEFFFLLLSSSTTRIE